LAYFDLLGETKIRTAAPLIAFTNSVHGEQMTCHWLTTTTITAADFVFTGKRDRAVERIRNKPRAHNPGRVRLQRNVCPIVERRARLRSSNIIGWRI